MLCITDSVMVVTVGTASEFEAGRPRLLFQGRYLQNSGYGSRNYDIAPDGRRFLMIKPGVPIAQLPQINVVLNWFEELKAKLGN